MKLLKLRANQEKDEWEYDVALDFWPYDPKVSTMLQNLPTKQMTPVPKFVPFSFQHSKIPTENEVSNEKTQKVQESSDSITTIKIQPSNIQQSVEQSIQFLLPKNKHKYDKKKKINNRMPDESPPRSIQSKKIISPANSPINNNYRNGISKNRNVEISPPYNFRHVEGNSKISPKSISYDVNNTTYELLKNYKITYNSFEHLELRELERFKALVSSISPKKPNPIDSNCRPGYKTKLNEDDSKLHTSGISDSETKLSEHLDNEVSSLFEIDQVLRENTLSGSLELGHKIDPSFQKFIISSDAAYPIKSPVPINGNIKAMLSFTDSPEELQVSPFNEKSNLGINPQKREEIVSTNEFSSSSIFSINLKSTTKATIEVKQDHNKFLDTYTVLNEALKNHRLCRAFSDDFENDNDYNDSFLLS